MDPVTKRLQTVIRSHFWSPVMACPEDPTSNRLLAALTDADWPHWRRHLESVDLRVGQALYEPGRPQLYAYFPTSWIVSLLYLMGSGASSEVAVVGNEGVVGTSLFLGGGTTTSHGSVLIAGQGFRIGAQMIRDEFERSDSVRLLLLRYTQALTTQIAQTAACNRHHAIDPGVRLAAAQPGSRAGLRSRGQAATHCQHAGRAPRERDRGSWPAAGRRAGPLRARPYLGA